MQQQITLPVEQIYNQLSYQYKIPKKITPKKIYKVEYKKEYFPIKDAILQTIW